MPEIKECGWGKTVIKRIADKVREVSGFDPKETTDFKSIVEAFGGKIVEIQAICSKVLVDEVIEKFGKNVKIEPQSKDKFKMILEANELGFKFWAMRNIDVCTVIKPKSLVAEIKKVLEEASKKYK